MRIAPIVLVALSIGSGTNACLRSSLAQRGSKPDQRMWSEFVSLMKDGRIAEGHFVRIRGDLLTKNFGEQVPDNLACLLFMPIDVRGRWLPA